MIDLPMALALSLRWREPEERSPRFRTARRITRAVRNAAREWHRASEEEWLTRIERPFSHPTHTP